MEASYFKHQEIQSKGAQLFLRLHSENCSYKILWFDFYRTTI